jgi:hypothetical protein
MTDITVASMQRNEGKYIIEWFAYYLLQGVNHFVIYNHQSTDDTEAIWRKLARHYYIDIHNRTGYNVHYPMLQHALTEVLPTTDWLVFADMDEFYFPIEKYTMREVLEERKDWNCSAFGVYWCQFGSSGYIDDPNLVLASYVHRGPLDLSTNHHMKSIVKGRGRAGTVSGTNPHVFTTEHGTIDFVGRVIPPHAGHNIAVEPCHEVMRLNHYQCKSWEYFKTRKQVRGSTADRPPEAPGAQIPDSVFHDYDHNEVFDDSIWTKYKQQLIPKIQSIKEQIGIL